MTERNDVPPKLQIGDAPIDPKFSNLMKILANTIDRLFNGDSRPKPNGFILIVFPFGEIGGPERANYISNAKREDVVVMLRAQLRRFEGMGAGEGNA